MIDAAEQKVATIRVIRAKIKKETRMTKKET
jgi:hypothetical protein